MGKMVSARFEKKFSLLYTKVLLFSSLSVCEFNTGKTVGISCSNKLGLDVS